MKLSILPLLMVLPVVGCSAIEDLNKENTIELTSLIVFKDAQKKQCMGDGIALDVMAKEITDAGMTVSCSTRSNDGKMYAQACGMDEGTINVFKVEAPKADGLLKLNDLGFEAVTDLKLIKELKGCK